MGVISDTRAHREHGHGHGQCAQRFTFQTILIAQTMSTAGEEKNIRNYEYFVLTTKGN